MKTTRSHVISRWLIAIVFCGAGILHFVFPAPYAHIIPPIFPAPRTLVLISGICEILGGLGVLLPQVRRQAGYGLIALLFAVFPANIYMAMQQQQAHGWTIGTFILLLRLPLQFLLMAWVYKSTIAKD
jgi:uncharacterized membrane protein